MNNYFLGGGVVGLLLITGAFTFVKKNNPEKSGSETFKVRLGIFPSTNDQRPMRLIIDDANLDEPPPLFRFILDSDFVVIGSLIDMKPVGKREKKPTQGNTFNVEDWLVGNDETLEIEELLYARNSFFSGEHLNSNSLRTIRTYRAMGDLQTVLEKNIRYLFFLKRIPKDAEIFRTLELDPELPYYLPYFGTKTIFPSENGSMMHGPKLIGVINISSGRYTRLIDQIRTLCRALSPANQKERFAQLKELAEEDDEILRTNAAYAIRYLSEKNYKRKD